MVRPKPLPRIAALMVVTLVVLGIGAGVVRTLFPRDLGLRLEPARERAWRGVGLRDPHPLERQRTIEWVEGRYAAAPGAIALHAAGGSLFLLLASLQFVARIRERHPAFHRWSGRLLVATGLTISAPAVYFGVLRPSAGWREAVIIAIATGYFAASLLGGVLAIRRGDAELHRQRMLRAFAAAVGIAVIRVVAAVADVTLTPRGWLLEDVFVLSLAIGWAVTMAAAELRIRRVASRQGSSA
jgi:uncharacterized membrane protein